jgi:choline dehydrogenase-like flavoprotein
MNSMTEQYDAIIVGSGAGGASAAYKLVHAGRRVLLIEKGAHLPRDGSTLDTKAVFQDGVFKNKRTWVDGQNREFIPDEFYNVGGKTKWYGAALLRFSPHEFRADPDHQCLAWPFGYEELEPYYREAESLLHVESFENEPELQTLLDKITSADAGWQSEPLPLGLRKSIADDPEEAKHFDGYASVSGCKSDAEWCLLEHISDKPNFTLLTEKPVAELISSEADPSVVTGVRCADGSVYSSSTVVLAAGAMTSPRILQDYLYATGLMSRLACAESVGSNFKLHINSAVLGFSPFTRHDVLRKTAILYNTAFPHSTVQPLGWLDGEILGTQLPAAVPKFVLRAAGARAIGFFVTTEDGSHPDNRVVSCAGSGTPVMDYELSRIEPAHREHKEIVKAWTGRLLRAGLIGADKYMGMAGTAHALGSMVTGNNPESSVVDADGKVHGMEGLYVGDGSVLPRSSRVNPGLTIFAWGLRLGDHLARRTV